MITNKKSIFEERKQPKVENQKEQTRKKSKSLDHHHHHHQQTKSVKRTTRIKEEGKKDLICIKGY